jgi:hypothetical protein
MDAIFKLHKCGFETWCVMPNDDKRVDWSWKKSIQVC